eukprot:5796934-Pleurochrysis_carterae.AAC.2
MSDVCFIRRTGATFARRHASAPTRARHGSRTRVWRSAEMLIASSKLFDLCSKTIQPNKFNHSTRPVELARYGRGKRKSVLTPVAGPSEIGSPTIGIATRGCAAASKNEHRVMPVQASVALRRLAVRLLGHVEEPIAFRDHTRP